MVTNVTWDGFINSFLSKNLENQVLLETLDFTERLALS